jgi:DNA-binding IscR family transcriptional regulator
MSRNTRLALGIQVLTQLAGSAKHSGELAKALRIHPVVVRRILPLLQRADLIHTTKGQFGCSMLLRSPKAISVGEVYVALYGQPLFHLPQISGGRVGETNKRLKIVFCNAQSSMVRKLRTISIASLTRS